MPQLPSPFAFHGVGSFMFVFLLVDRLLIEPSLHPDGRRFEIFIFNSILFVLIDVHPLKHTYAPRTSYQEGANLAHAEDRKRASGNLLL